MALPFLPSRIAMYAPHDSRQKDSSSADHCRQLIARAFGPAAQIFEYAGAGTSHNNKGATDFEYLIQDARAGRFEALVVNTLAVLGDDPVSVSQQLLSLDRAGVVVIAAQDQYCSDASLVMTFFPQPRVPS